MTARSPRAITTAGCSGAFRHVTSVMRNVRLWLVPAGSVKWSVARPVVRAITIKRFRGSPRKSMESLVGFAGPGSGTPSSSTASPIARSKSGSAAVGAGAAEDDAAKDDGGTGAGESFEPPHAATSRRRSQSARYAPYVLSR